MHEKIINKLCSNGFESYLIGGAVRDLFLGHTPDDYDVVTNAKIEDLKSLFNNCKINVVGESFQVCIINNVEVSRYRKDKYFGLSDKNCEIEPASSIHEDLSRRDLTINAMALCPYTGEIIDPYNGWEDLRDNIVRFVGNPEERIDEDPCRILRACRFVAKINGEFDYDTRMALKKYSYLVDKYVASERKRLEIIKALKTIAPHRFFESLKEIDALKYIFPSLNKCVIDGGKYHNETVFEHCMLVGNAISKKCLLTKLAGYLHDVGKPLVIDENYSFPMHEKAGEECLFNELYNLRFSSDEIHRINGLVKMHMQNITSAKGKSIRRTLAKLRDYDVPYREFLRLKFADRRGNKAKNRFSLYETKNIIRKFENEIFSDNRASSITEIDINGNEIMKQLNINTGPKVGYVLKFLHSIIINYPLLNNNEKLKIFLNTFKIIHRRKV